MSGSFSQQIILYINQLGSGINDFGSKYCYGYTAKIYNVISIEIRYSSM